MNTIDCGFYMAIGDINDGGGVYTPKRDDMYCGMANMV